jgi:hypothetical protein
MLPCWLATRGSSETGDLGSSPGDLRVVAQSVEPRFLWRKAHHCGASGLVPSGLDIGGGQRCRHWRLPARSGSRPEAQHTSRGLGPARSGLGIG